MGEGRQDYQEVLKTSKHRNKKIILLLSLILLPVLKYGFKIPYQNTMVSMNIPGFTFFVLWSANLFILCIVWLDSVSFEAFKSKIKFKEAVDRKEEAIKRNIENVENLKKILENDQEIDPGRLKELGEISKSIKKEQDELHRLRRDLTHEERIALFSLAPVDVLNRGEIRRSLLVTLTIVYFIVIFYGNVLGGEVVTSITWIYFSVIAFYIGSRSVEKIVEAKRR